MSSITDATIMHHVIIILLLLWMLNSFNYCHPVAYFLSLIYLYMIHEIYIMRLRRKLQYEEKRNANQRRVLSDSESVRWLNNAIEKIWPICMEEIVSQKILLPIVPWFLQKYKPWTVKEATVQHLYLGRSPPMFTEMRVLREPCEDDHLVLELGMSFLTADDMSALLAVKLKKRLGLGMCTKLHLLGMHIEGKVLVGVKFIRQWPYIGRLRVCFAEPPYFQMTVKPLFAHGLDVTELPGIAGWLDKLLAVAFEQSLVEPNMLVVDVEKFVAPQPENWFSVDAKEPVAHAVVEVLEADEMKPSDFNGLADPYVKGQLGPYRFRTKVKKKTLAPKWHEEFKVPICSWESTVLKIEVRDKDHLVDDKLGECSIIVGDLRDGQRHDMWLSLQNVKIGRLHLALTIVEIKENGKESEEASDEQPLDNDDGKSFHADESAGNESVPAGTPKKSQRVLDSFEPIVIEGQQGTGIWVHHPGSEVAQIWEPRKGRTRVGSQIKGESGDVSVKSTGSGSGQNELSGSDDNGLDAGKPQSRNAFRRGLHKINSVFHKSLRHDDKSFLIGDPMPSPHDNLKSVNSKDITIRYLVEKEDQVLAPFLAKSPKADGKQSSEESNVEIPGKREGIKDKAKGLFKQAGKSANGLKTVLSRNSGRAKAESESFSTERGDAVSYSSDDESLRSSVDTSGFRSDSFKSKEDVHHIIPGDDINNADTAGFRGDSFKFKEDAHHIIPGDDINNATREMSTEGTKLVDNARPEKSDATL